jgi:hypothetical protein
MEHKMSSNAYLFYYVWLAFSRSQWTRGLRRGHTAARSLALHVPMPSGARISVSRVLEVSCDCPIIRPEESYLVGFV